MVAYKRRKVNFESAINKNQSELGPSEPSLLFALVPCLWLPDKNTSWDENTMLAMAAGKPQEVHLQVYLGTPGNAPLGKDLGRANGF